MSLGRAGRKRLLIISIVLIILILPYFINGFLLTETWGQFKAERWFHKHEEALTDVNNNLLQAIEDQMVEVNPNYTDLILLPGTADTFAMAEPYTLNRIWASHDDTIIVYRSGYNGLLLTTSAEYGVYYSADDTAVDIFTAMELEGNSYTAERIKPHWFTWWMLY